MLQSNNTLLQPVVAVSSSFEKFTSFCKITGLILPSKNPAIFLVFPTESWLQWKFYRWTKILEDSVDERRWRRPDASKIGPAPMLHRTWTSTKFERSCRFFFGVSTSSNRVVSQWYNHIYPIPIFRNSRWNSHSVGSGFMAPWLPWILCLKTSARKEPYCGNASIVWGQYWWY